MVIENSSAYTIRFWAHWFFFALVLSPVVLYLDYHSVNQGFDKIYGSTVLLLALLLLIARGTGNVVFRSYIPIGIFLAIYYTSWDIILWQDTVARKGIFYEFLLNRTLHAVAVLFLVDNILFSKKLIDVLVFLMKGLIVVGALVSLLQVVYDPFLFVPEKFQVFMLHYDWGVDTLQIRRLSIFGYTNINDIGFSFLPMLALVVGYEIREKKNIPVLMLLLGFFVSVVSNSRYIQVGFFLAAAPTLFYQGRILRNSLVAIVGVVFLVLFMGFVLQLIGYDVGRYVDERLLDEGASTRLLAFQIFGKFFPDNPYFGTGQHLSDEVVVALEGRSSQIHVGYLSHLFSYGVAGTSLAFLFWGFIAHRMWVVARRTGFYGSFFGFLVFLWANVTMVFYWVYTFGLALCYLFASYYDSKENEPDRNN